jgi:hypothetical protein
MVRLKKISDGGGLYLEITPTGDKKYWRLQYRFAGKEKRLAIGVYPFVGLADARKKRDEAKKMLSDGFDPSLEKNFKNKKFLRNQKIALSLLLGNGIASNEKTLLMKGIRRTSCIA